MSPFDSIIAASSASAVGWCALCHQKLEIALFATEDVGVVSRSGGGKA